MNPGYEENSMDVSVTSRKKRNLEDFEFVDIDSKHGKSSILGKGAYGVVKLVKLKESGRLYAMKIVCF